MKSFFYDKGVSLDDCFHRYCELERMVGSEQYFCDECGRKSDASKRTLFANLPQCLVLHLKRFRFEAGWFGNKNTKQVSFPLNDLDLHEFVGQSQVARGSNEHAGGSAPSA